MIVVSLRPRLGVDLEWQAHSPQFLDPTRELMYQCGLPRRSTVGSMFVRCDALPIEGPGNSRDYLKRGTAKRGNSHWDQHVGKVSTEGIGWRREYDAGLQRALSMGTPEGSGRVRKTGALYS